MTKGTCSVRPTTYRGVAGYKISGTNGRGRRTCIFVEDKDEAVRVRKACNEGRDPWEEGR